MAAIHITARSPVQMVLLAVLIGDRPLTWSRGSSDSVSQAG